MGLLTPNRITFHHSPTPLLLPLLSGSGQSLPLPTLATSATPSSCPLNPLLFTGHLQTAWTTISKSDTPIFYKRAVFSAQDPRFPGSFAVDFVVPANELVADPEFPPRTSGLSEEELQGMRGEDKRPMLVALHGLTGGSHEEYLKQIVARLQNEGQKEEGQKGDGGALEWEVCVVNSRGCGMSKIESGVLFNGRATWDVRQLVGWLRDRFPNRPLMGLGCSLGANILVNVRWCTLLFLLHRLLLLSAESLSPLPWFV